MDPWQIANGTAAIVALVASQWSWIRVQQTTRHHVIVVHVAHTAILLWYAILNLGLGTGAVELDHAPTPLFRYAFAPLLITYSLKQVMASARVVRSGDL